MPTLTCDQCDTEFVVSSPDAKLVKTRCPQCHAFVRVAAPPPVQISRINDPTYRLVWSIVSTAFILAVAFSIVAVIVFLVSQ